MVDPKLRARALPPKKKKKAQPQDPETADEFHVAGQTEEEGGEKWRAGDIVKSSRFFMRAMEFYSRGLQRYPRNLDLAYNRARLLAKICEESRMLQAYQQTVSESAESLLQRAILYHEEALTLSPEDADLIFNFAQLLRDIGEKAQEAGSEDEALSYFTRAFGLFEKCDALQRAELAQQESAQQEIPDQAPVDDTQMDDAPARETDSASADGEYATEREAVTYAALYDTNVAALECLLDICQSTATPSVEELHVKGNALLGNIEILANKARAQDEDWATSNPTWNEWLLNSRFQVTVQDARCRLNESPNITLYTQLIWSLFRFDRLSQGNQNLLDCLSDPDTPSDSSFSHLTGFPAQWLADLADADLQLHNTFDLILTRSSSSSSSSSPSPSTLAPDELTKAAKIRWTHLSRANAALQKLSALPAAQTKDVDLSPTRVHEQRAECYLYMRQLGRPRNGGLHASSAPTLAENAEKMYRGAKGYAQQRGEESGDLLVRENIAHLLARGAIGARVGAEDLGRNLDEMLVEGLLSEEDAEVVRAKCG